VSNNIIIYIFNIPDFLRRQHLKDLIIGVADNNPQLIDIVVLVNLLQEGKTPLPVHGALFDASLIAIAIAKEQGGIRPIAMSRGDLLTIRWPAVIADPNTTGFGVSGGPEAAVRAARRFLDNRQRSQLFLKIDFRNAFTRYAGTSSLERLKNASEQLPYTPRRRSAAPHISSVDIVHLAIRRWSSTCLVFKELLKSLQSELVLGYLDDVAVGDIASIMLKDFILLETTTTNS